MEIRENPTGHDACGIPNVHDANRSGLSVENFGVGGLKRLQEGGCLTFHVVTNIQLQLRPILQNENQTLNDKAVPAAAELSVNRLDPAENPLYLVQRDNMPAQSRTPVDSGRGGFSASPA